MGWFDSLWPSAKSSDPLGSIDPKVRDFLQRESPIKYEARVDAEAKAAQANPEAAAAAAAATAATQQTDDKPVVPKESLFQDGRYAHLWKGYRSQGEVENENKTDHEKLMDVLEGFKDRKQLIAQAALENCAIQQDEWINCMKHGDWEDRLQMCRKQVQRFERCYTMQNRFLKALGYRAELGRSQQVEDDIQMHADSLYTKMLEQEQRNKDAKEKGLPVADLGKLYPRPANEIEPGVELRKQWDEQIAKLPVEERAAEEAALRADFQAKAAVAKDVQKLWDEQAAERKAREEQGKTTIKDRVTDIFRIK
ncbi:hypothetical protein B0T11DRAFT_270016 [Plectosphaerella cucumerina]|uniref:Autophagy protein n=1 Tax=Plectosphaerella cucumerina TaxID=40658 RepID=A0A8K0TN18_9PEZI|nr:hypothetical protein B0T11DRAFT_270016 [Plectosphaerella cucumerina]